MIRKTFALACVSAAMIGTAAAQTTTPPSTTPSPTAPTMQQRAPAERTTQSSLRADEISTRSFVGMTIYAPKPAEGTASAPATTTDPATTGSTITPGGATTGSTVAPGGATTAMAPATVSDEQWRQMRERHDNIGSVNEVVLATDGRVRQVVVGVGGFLGIGEKAVALDWSDIKLMRDSNGKLFGVVMRTKDQLNAMPAFVSDRS